MAAIEMANMHVKIPGPARVCMYTIHRWGGLSSRCVWPSLGSGMAAGLPDRVELDDDEDQALMGEPGISEDVVKFLNHMLVYVRCSIRSFFELLNVAS